MKQIYFYLFISLGLLACSSPQKSFDKGNYEKAYRGAVKDFKKGKRSRKDKVVLNSSFEELLKQRSLEAERYLASDMIEDWEKAYREYNELLELYYDGKGYLDKGYDRRMQKIDESYRTLGTDIAYNYYELGSMSMDAYHESYSKLPAQDAFLYFEKTRKYDRNFENIDSLLEDAFGRAVIVLMVEADAPFNLSHQWEIDDRFSDLEGESEGFLQVAYERVLTNADCVLEIDFSSLDVDRRESSNTRNYSEQIEDGYTTQVDSTGKSIRVTKYRTVEGSVTTITDNYTYRWRASVRAQGNRNYCDFKNRIFDADETVAIEQYELSGDRDAIPERYKQNNRSRIDEDDIVEELVDDLYLQISRYYF